MKSIILIVLAVLSMCSVLFFSYAPHYFDGAIGPHFVATGLLLMLKALEKEGFTRSEIDLIMGGNIRDFFLRNLPE